MKRLLPLYALAVLVLSSEIIQAQTTGEITVHYIDVGQGDAILIEFPKAAIMIDAGGEDTGDTRFRDHLLDRLNELFKRRGESERVIDAIIITHPHLDHTRYLPDILKQFKVKTLIDGGTRLGSGIVPLNQARQIINASGGRYIAVRQADFYTKDYNQDAFQDINIPDVTLRLLNGSRNCDDQNNDSLVLFVQYRNKRFLFTGDAEAMSDKSCRDEISMLTERYQISGLLRADVLKVNFHGSASGVTDEWMKLISPQISVISAGRSDREFRAPGQFHAWQFGHPRDSAVKIIRGRTYGVRKEPKPVTTMIASQLESKQIMMTNAVYCTCWDGDISITTDGKNLRVVTSR